MLQLGAGSRAGNAGKEKMAEGKEQKRSPACSMEDTLYARRDCSYLAAHYLCLCRGSEGKGQQAGSHPCLNTLLAAALHWWVVRMAVGGHRNCQRGKHYLGRGGKDAGHQTCLQLRHHPSTGMADGCPCLGALGVPLWGADSRILVLKEGEAVCGNTGAVG